MNTTNVLEILKTFPEGTLLYIDVLGTSNILEPDESLDYPIIITVSTFEKNVTSDLNLVKILENATNRTRVYSPAFGYGYFGSIKNHTRFPICINFENCVMHFTSDGKFNIYGECVLFPSKENKDWNNFKI